MSSNEVNSQSLREKLKILGYNQSVPVSAVPIVGILLEDLIKTTESLRNAKLEVAKYLEEKACWELGVEPYKCDNSRLLAECNTLNLELIKQKDDYEERICDYRQTIRNLQADKQHLEEHCAQLEKNVRDLLVKVSGGSKSSKNDVNMSRKPFISTVKSGRYVANPTDVSNAYRCAKCSSIVWTKHLEGKVQEVQLMQNGIQTQADQIGWLKDKLERRDREISRLNDLLSGGRPPEVLARDCCYKNVGTLSEDVEDLQKEKSDLLKKYRDAQDAMHEAMQRAISLEEKNRNLERELEEFQKEALCVESEANAEIFKKENEINALKKELDKLKSCQEKNCGNSIDDKRKLYEQLNSLTQKEKELLLEVERLKKKNSKLKVKAASLQKCSLNDDAASKLNAAEEEVNRYRSERDFFQKEYLKIVEQSASVKEVKELKLQLECKDNEVKTLSKQLLQTKYQDDSRPSSCHSVQAAIMRAERERDVLKEEIQMLQMERDRLREKLGCKAESEASDRCRIAEENRVLQSRICNLEAEKREILASQIPERTQLYLIKEELEEMRKRVQELQAENHKLSTTNNQLKILQGQTEKALIDHQNKLLAAETNLENAEYRLSIINTSRESAGKETNTLQREIAILKSNNSCLEAEKDKILSELDSKTEVVYQLENDLKTANKQKHDLQCKVKTLEKKLGDTANKKQEYECELQETSTESKTLREQIHSLKLSRDEILSENCRITNDLAETTSELRLVKQQLKGSEKEVEKLKQQLQQYVQEVKRAEELLLLKEHEREEMLEHYRSLSHDAVLLEGNNQSLEIEAAEQRQLLCDAQTEVDNLKKELNAKVECILKLENQVSLLSSQIVESQAELEQNFDELRLLKVDLEASKDLIAKLDVQRDKLNAELEESKSIRCQLENELKEIRENMNLNLEEEMQFSTLSASRKELEHEKLKTCQLNQEIALLKKKMRELEDKLSRERQKSLAKESLAKEYSVKIQELQQALTNARFEQSRAREGSPSKVTYETIPLSFIFSNETYDIRAAVESSTPKQSIKTNTSPSSEFASLSNQTRKNVIPGQKRALEHDIKHFLNSENGLRDSVHEHEEKVSLNENESNIIVRRRRIIKTKATSSVTKKTLVEDEIRAAQLKVSPMKQKHDMQSSNKDTLSRTDVFLMRAKPQMNMAERQSSNESIPKRNADFNPSNAKTNSCLQFRLLSGIESKKSAYPSTTDISCSYYPPGQMVSSEMHVSDDKRTDFVFHSDANFLPGNRTEIEIVAAPARSESKYISVGATCLPSISYFLVEDGKCTPIKIDATEGSFQEEENMLSNEKVHLPLSDPSSCNNPLFSQNDCYPHVDVSVESLTSRISKNPENPQVTIATATQASPLPAPSKACSCMQNRKMQILASFNLPVDQAEPRYTSNNSYYRTCKLYRTPNGYETESSSGVERTSARKHTPTVKPKNLDLSKLPPPPELPRKAK